MASSQSTGKYKYIAVSQCQKNSTGCKHCDEDNDIGRLLDDSQMSDVDSFDEDNNDTTILRTAQLSLEQFYLRRVKEWKHAFWCCLCCLLFCIITITIVVTSHFLRYDIHKLNDDGNSCSSRSCVLAASEIAGSLDESVNPCEDFYGFACGGWKIHNAIPSGKSYYDAFDKQERWVKKALKILLEEECSEQTETSSECKTKLVYKTCNDIDTINAYGITPLRNLIDKFDGWSVTGTWNQSNFNLSRLFKNIARYNVGIFFKLDVDLNPLNTSQNRILIDTTGLTLGSGRYYIGKSLEDPTLKAYHSYMTDAVVLLGVERNTSYRLMGNVLEFEIELASIQMADDSSSHDRNYRILSFAQLQRLSPAIDWTDIITSLVGGVGILDLTQEIVTSYSKYLGKLSNLIKNTSSETLQNYVIWHLAGTFLNGLGKEYIDLTIKLDRNIYGSSADSCNERWLWCVKFVENQLKLPTGRLFIERHFDLDNKKMAETVVGEIKESFKRKLLTTTWLDEDTVALAMQKAVAVKDAIGYPDIIQNKTAMDSMFLDLNPISKTFFDINIELHEHDFKQSLKKLLKPANIDDWTERTTALNAFFSHTSNEIVLPAGILQPPAYKSDYPQSLNFGGIGFVVAHELTHGFDDSGRRFDSHGNINEWWKNDTLKKFNDKAQCFVEQYSQFNSFGGRIDGVRTLSENIADNAGVRLAYDAYMRWRSTKKGIDDPLLPSLKYSHEQLFFISFAQMWCASDTLQHARQFLVKATHAPNDIRVTASVRNMDEFADAFRCRLGSKMNPEEKCVLW